MTELTAQIVREALGDIDDEVVVNIVASGGTEADLLKAVTWLRARDDFNSVGEEAPTGIVARLCEIIDAAEIDLGEEP